MQALTDAGSALLASARTLLPSAAAQRSYSHTDSLKKEIVITEILIHPIKSCRGTSVQQTKYDHAGLQYDRTWLIVDSNTKKFYTARELPKMLLIHPVLDIEGGHLTINIPQSDTGVPATSVQLSLDPSQDELDKRELVDGITIWGSIVDGYAVSDQADQMLSKYFGKSVRLVRKGPSPRDSGPTDPSGPKEWEKATVRYQDFYPCLVASVPSLRHVQETLTASVYPGMSSGEDVKAYKVPKSVNTEYWTPEELSMLPITRFRPNIIVDSAPSSEQKLVPWEEDGWLSAELFDSNQSAVPMGTEAEGKGRAGVYLLERCARCMVPNIDPDTGVRDNVLPYRLLQEYRQVDKQAATKGKPCFGMLSVPREKEGIIKVGDQVRVTATTDPETR